MVVDIFRATSVICTALSEGVSEVIPVNEINDVKPFLNKNEFINLKKNKFFWTK